MEWSHKVTEPICTYTIDNCDKGYGILGFKMVKHPGRTRGIREGGVAREGRFMRWDQSPNKERSI